MGGCGGLASAAPAAGATAAAPRAMLSAARREWRSRGRGGGPAARREWRPHGRGGGRYSCWRALLLLACAASDASAGVGSCGCDNSSAVLAVGEAVAATRARPGAAWRAWRPRDGGGGSCCRWLVGDASSGAGGRDGATRAVMAARVAAAAPKAQLKAQPTAFVARAVVAWTRRRRALHMPVCVARDASGGTGGCGGSTSPVPAVGVAAAAPRVRPSAVGCAWRPRCGGGGSFCCWRAWRATRAAAWAAPSARREPCWPLAWRRRRRGRSRRLLWRAGGRGGGGRCMCRRARRATRAVAWAAATARREPCPPLARRRWRLRRGQRPPWPARRWRHRGRGRCQCLRAWRSTRVAAWAAVHWRITERDGGGGSCCRWLVGDASGGAGGRDGATRAVMAVKGTASGLCGGGIVAWPS